jgi:hypothetical protein
LSYGKEKQRRKRAQPKGEGEIREGRILQALSIIDAVILAKKFSFQTFRFSDRSKLGSF